MIFVQFDYFNSNSTADTPASQLTIIFKNK